MERKSWPEAIGFFSDTHKKRGPLSRKLNRFFIRPLTDKGGDGSEVKVSFWPCGQTDKKKWPPGGARVTEN